MSKKIVIALIIIIGSFLRILNIMKHSLWCDELLAISIGSQPIRWIINYITYNDAHPPLFYCLVRLLLKIGKGEIFLRILPLFFGIITIPFTYLLGKKFEDEKTGIILSLFTSLSPPLILWSQIIKSYTLLTFLTVLSFIIFFEILNCRKKKFVYLLIFLNTLLLYTHNFSFIVILIQFFILLYRKKINKIFIQLLLTIFLLYLPWLVRLPYQLKFTLGVKRPIPFTLRIPYILFYFFNGESLNPFELVFTIPILIINLIVLLYGVKKLKKLTKEKKIFLYTTLIFPLFFSFFPSTVPQNLIHFSIFFYLLFSLCLQNFKTNLVYLYFIFFLPSIFFYHTDNIYHYHDTSKLVPYREIYLDIEKKEIKGDIILTTEKMNEYILSPIQWYYKGKSKIYRITNIQEIDEILKKSHLRIWIVLDFINNPEISRKLRNYFEEKYNKIFENKYIFNEKWLSRLKGEREFYYLVEVYLFEIK